MRKGNRILSGLLALVIAAVMLLCPAAAISYEPDFTPTSKAVYLENLDTGLILYEKNADEKMYPASLTKIMTAIVVLENVKDLDGETAEYPMWIQNMLYGTNASLGGLIVGEELTIRQGACRRYNGYAYRGSDQSYRKGPARNDRISAKGR